MPALGPPGALSPRDWNAIVNYDQWRDLFSPDDGVALHHGGGSDYRAGRAPYSRAREIQQLQQWEGYHLYSKGWRGLAYGWGVGQTGTIYRIRGWATYGAHTGDIDGDGISNNAEIVPIIFIGSGDHHDLSPAAQNSIERLRRFIEESSPRATRLYGHQELKGTVTQCPGPKGMAYVTANRELEDGMALTANEEQFVKDLFSRMKALYPNDPVPTAAGLSTYLIPDVRKNIVTMDELQSIVSSSGSVDEVARKLAKANAEKLARIKEAI